MKKDKIFWGPVIQEIEFPEQIEYKHKLRFMNYANENQVICQHCGTNMGSIDTFAIDTTQSPIAISYHKECECCDVEMELELDLKSVEIGDTDVDYEDMAEFDNLMLNSPMITCNNCGYEYETQEIEQDEDCIKYIGVCHECDIKNTLKMSFPEDGKQDVLLIDEDNIDVINRNTFGFQGFEYGECND